MYLMYLNNMQQKNKISLIKRLTFPPLSLGKRILQKKAFLLSYFTDSKFFESHSDHSEKCKRKWGKKE